MSLYNCAVPVTFKNIVFNGAIGISSSKHVSFNNCILNGSDAVALYLGDGAICHMDTCELYNSQTLVNLQSGSTFISNNIIGGDANTTFLAGSYSTVLMTGTRPDGNVALTACLSNPQDPSLLPTTGGTTPTPPTPVSSVEIAASSSCTYHGNAWYSDDDVDIRQGFLDMGGSGKRVQTGCMWFDVTSLTLTTIQNVTLTLTRKAGSGISGDVHVDLYGTKTDYRDGIPDSSANKVTFSGPAEIGTIGNGETKTFTIPNEAITALKNGTIKGLMLQVGDNTLRNGKLYSTNYAVFYGAGTEYAPVLTVIGQ